MELFPRCNVAHWVFIYLDFTLISPAKVSIYCLLAQVNETCGSPRQSRAMRYSSFLQMTEYQKGLLVRSYFFHISLRSHLFISGFLCLRQSGPSFRVRRQCSSCSPFYHGSLSPRESESNSRALSHPTAEQNEVWPLLLVNYPASMHCSCRFLLRSLGIWDITPHALSQPSRWISHDKYSIGHQYFSRRPVYATHSQSL